MDNDPFAVPLVPERPEHSRSVYDFRSFRRLVLIAVVGYGLYAAWRVYPRFDSKFFGHWVVSRNVASLSTLHLGPGGSGGRGTSESIRWWACGNKLVTHAHRGNRTANLREILIYSARTLLFLGPPEEVSEYTILKITDETLQLEKTRGLNPNEPTRILTYYRD